MTPRDGDGGDDPAARGAALRAITAADWMRRAHQRLYDETLVPLWTELDFAALQHERDRAQAAIAGYERSTSWRMTAPLRWLARRLRRPAGREEVGGRAWVDQGSATPLGDTQVLTFQPVATAAPTLAIVLDATEGTPAALEATLTAIRPSLPDSCSLIALCVANSPAHCVLGALADRSDVRVVPLRAAVSDADRREAGEASAADFVCFMRLPDVMAEGAVDAIRGALSDDAAIDLLFGDEDGIGADGAGIFYKPDWDPELQAAGDLVGRLVVVSRRALRGVGPAELAAGAGWYRDLALRVAAQCRPDRIGHVPAILHHRAVTASEPSGRGGMRVWACPRDTAPSDPPLVSVIVPTRDSACLLRTCAEGVLNATRYARLELLIVDNDTREPEALAVLSTLARDARVRIVPSPGDFNWSVLNNAAAAVARGQILVLLNDDIRIIDEDWLHELVRYGLREEIGVVGAMLLYPDRTLQHAGIVMDAGGVPKHLLRRNPHYDTALGGILTVPRSVSAVTGACLAVRRAVFDQVGGLDEGFAISCNDVDFCLRVRAHGYRNIMTPFAVLEHRERATRGQDVTAERQIRAWSELDRLNRHWGGAALMDPYLNANLVLVDEQPQPRPPRWHVASHSARIDRRPRSGLGASGRPA